MVQSTDTESGTKEYRIWKDDRQLVEDMLRHFSTRANRCKQASLYGF